MARVAELDDGEGQRVMLEMPFEKCERRKYLKYDRDLAYVCFEADLWQRLSQVRSTDQDFISARKANMALAAVATQLEAPETAKACAQAAAILHHTMAKT